LADKRCTGDILIALAPGKWEELMELDGRKVSFLERAFENQPTCKLSYGYLVKDWGEPTQSLLSFLVVEPMLLKQTVKKQESKHSSERCPNYAGIKAIFRDDTF